MLIELKKGNKIYIKPKNRGKFTKYCHGKVTSECIARGKRSSDPIIRKRATFAANARKWKHQEGGAIINESPIVAQRMLWLQNLGNQQQEQERIQKLQLKQQEIDRFNSMFNTFSDIGLTLLDKYLTKKNASPQQTNTV